MRLGFCGLIFAGLTVYVTVACAQPVTPTATPARPANAAPFPSRVLRQTTFNIPFTVETANQPLEVQLYLSRDRGQTWKLYARQNPSARFFPFHATQDGEFWFASQTIDATRAPADMEGRQPELHVVIDTLQPQFDFQALLGPSREIQISWRCADPSLDPASLKIEYQTGREQPWQPVAAESTTTSNGTISGRLTFVPRTAWVELQVRAEISDLARNKAVVTRRLTLAVGAVQSNQGQPNRGQSGWRPVASRAPNQQDRPVALPPTTPETGGVASTNPPAGARNAPDLGSRRYPVGYGRPPIGFGPATPYDSAAAAGIPADPYANARPSATTAPSPNPTAAAVARSNAADTASPSTAPTHTPSQNTTTDVAPTTEWKSTGQSAGPSSIYGGRLSQSDGSVAAPRHELVEGSGYQPQPSQVHPLVSQQIASPQSGQPTGEHPEDPSRVRPSDPSSPRPDLDATAPSAIRSDSNRVSIKQLRMTSATRFELDYEFDAAAANGVRSVELWGTRDEGQTWSRWQVDEDRQSPLDVRIDAEGTYGFRIVIVGNNGLAGDAPRNGDDAELWVGVDTTAPVVRLTTATYGEGEYTGKLDIRWSASDTSFGENPISIFFSDNAAGPWTTIAAGVPNSGQYYWPIDPRIPERLYLRIEARDRAGNLGEYRLPDPVNLSGFTPRARIRGIRPLTNSPTSDPSDLDSAPQATRNPYVYR